MIIETARQWIGTPFKHQGRVRGVGVDCAGLAIGISKDLGLPVIDESGYARSPKDNAMRVLIEQQCDAITKIEIGALLFMPHSGTLHLAIVSQLDPIYIIHAYQPAGKVVEHRLDSKWLRRVAKIYRVRNWPL